MSRMKVRTYSELVRLPTFKERYEYLRLQSEIGRETFGFDRYLNQNFYTSKEWRSVRDQIIIRDDGCDLGIPDYPINGRVIIHHMNPIQIEDLEEFNDDILNPEFLIAVSHDTHNAIHFGDANQLPQLPVERTPGDTRLW